MNLKKYLNEEFEVAKEKIHKIKQHHTDQTYKMVKNNIKKLPEEAKSERKELIKIYTDMKENCIKQENDSLAMLNDAVKSFGNQIDSLKTYDSNYQNKANDIAERISIVASLTPNNMNLGLTVDSHRNQDKIERIMENVPTKSQSKIHSKDSINPKLARKIHSPSKNDFSMSR